MRAAPKWFTPVAVIALLWNVLGCIAYLSDVTLSPEDVAKMSAAQQALYAARPAWAVGATALAVWGGALGCTGLIMRKRWATIAFLVSLLGVIVQDVALFGMTNVTADAGPTALGLQALVLAIAVALLFLGRHAQQREWIA